tara:strand:+ start:186 stop:2681 length:2496 start_codon:yes stop_codon:yes gene_type:complete
MTQQDKQETKNNKNRGDHQQKIKFFSWLRLLLQAVSRHGFALVFVLILLVIFRMPHLSDLTVVIIQLENGNDFVVMFFFYASILVMALLIGYGNLVNIDSVEERSQRIVDASLDSKKENQTKLLNKVTQAINLKDSKEKRLEEHKNQTESLAVDGTERNYEETEYPEEYVNRIYPKMLAVFMILGITFTVENTYFQLFGTLISFTYFFFLLTVFLIALTHPRFAAFLKSTFKWKSRNLWLPLIVLVASVGIIIILGIFNTGGTKSDIAGLFWSMMCLSIIFFFLSISYNKRVLWFKEKIAMPFAYIYTIALVVIYIVMLFDPELNDLKYLTPMVIIMICIIGLYTMFLGLNYLGKYTNWPILTIVFSAAILATVLVAKSDCFKHYEVSTVHAENIDPDERLTLEDYVDQFIGQRREAILAVKKNEQFPIILVSAEGGGSRAGHWAFLVHSYLYGSNEDYFKKHLFSITGASGGSVGSNMFYVQAYANKDKYDRELFLTKNSKETSTELQEKAKKRFRYIASEFYQSDYISSSIAGLLGRDIIASIFHLNFYRDRGEITEIEWEKKFDSLFDRGLLQRPYLDIMPKKGDTFTPPIMVTTTTHVQTGQLYVISPVKFNNNNERESGFNDFLSEYAKKNKSSQMIKRSSAMLLTARFPYLSPNGRVSGVGQFGDGGYYDNIGGTVTRFLEAALIKGLKKDSLLNGKYKIKHLIITNNTTADFADCPTSNQKKKDDVNYYTQLVTPGQMALNALFAHADEFVNATMDSYRIESKRTLIPIDQNKRPEIITQMCDPMFRPLIPLGRYLSVDAVRSLEERLKDPIEVRKQLDSILRY